MLIALLLLIVAASFPSGLTLDRVRRVECGGSDASGAREDDAALCLDERAYVSKGSRTISTPC